MVPKPRKSGALQTGCLQPMNISAEAISSRFCADLPTEIARLLDAMFPRRDADIALHEPRFNTQAEELVLEDVSPAKKPVRVLNLIS